MSGHQQIYDYMVREVLSEGGVTFEVVDKVTGETLSREFHPSKSDPYYMVASVFLIAHIFIFICFRFGMISPELVFFIEIATLALLSLLYRIFRRELIVFECNRRRSIFEVMRFLRPRNSEEKQQHSVNWSD